MKNLAVAGFVLLLAAVAGSAAWSAESVDAEGLLHVANGRVPAQGNKVIELREVWRHGADDDDDFFGMISQCVAGPDGLLYLLDMRLSEIAVYSRTGERVGTLSGEGDGPGETRLPSNLLMMPDGTLGLVQIFPGRITTIGSDGVPGAVVPFGDPATGGFVQLFDAVTNGERLVVVGESIRADGATAQERENFVGIFDLEGKEVARVKTISTRWDFTDFTWNESDPGRIDFRRVAAGPDGRIYVAAERDAYRIEVYHSDGTIDRVIEREFDPVARSDSEYETVRSIAEMQFGQIPNAKTIVAKTHPDISGLFFGPDGNLWVSHSRSIRDLPEGILATWDVFTPAGDFTRTVSARCEGEPGDDLLIWMPDGDAVLVTGFQEAGVSMQSQGSLGADDASGAEPMEVVYLQPVESGEGGRK